MLFILGMSWAISSGFVPNSEGGLPISAKVDESSINASISQTQSHVESEQRKWAGAFSKAQERALDLTESHKSFVKESAQKADEVSNKSAVIQNLNLSGSPSKCLLNQDCFGRMSKEQATNAQRRDLQFQPLVFVSSSMPKTSLQQLALEAKAKGARLIIRGMVNNSMKDTALLVKEINHPLDIDPKLFQKYGVIQVPTFVIPTENKGTKEWHVIRGNVSLGFAFDEVMGETTRDKQESHP